MIKFIKENHDIIKIFLTYAILFALAVLGGVALKFFGG